MNVKPTILYVEDDPNDAVVFERAFKKAGLEIDLQIAFDGQFAIEYLLGQEQYHDRLKYPLPELIISDMKMYRMGGVELLQWVRNHAKFQNLPVVLYSTSTEDLDVSVAAAAGATAYFRKTYHCTEVLEYLQKWLSDKGAKKDPPKGKATRQRLEPE